jgi:hypothetical protein
MGRNIFRDTGFRNVDLSVSKNFRLGERFKAQFRVEMFNIFNHPNFANPNGATSGYGQGAYSDPSQTGQFGCGCATPDSASFNPVLGSGSARAIQLGLKFTFKTTIRGCSLKRGRTCSGPSSVGESFLQVFEINLERTYPG